MLRPNYDRLNVPEREIVDSIYDAVNQYCKENGIAIAYDDRAEVFIEAIAKYIF